MVSAVLTIGMSFAIVGGAGDGVACPSLLPTSDVAPTGYQHPIAGGTPARLLSGGRDSTTQITDQRNAKASRPPCPFCSGKESVKEAGATSRRTSPCLETCRGTKLLTSVKESKVRHTDPFARPRPLFACLFQSSKKFRPHPLTINHYVLNSTGASFLLIALYEGSQHFLPPISPLSKRGNRQFEEHQRRKESL